MYLQMQRQFLYHIDVNQMFSTCVNITGTTDFSLFQYVLITEQKTSLLLGI